MEWEPTWMESQQKQQIPSRAVPASRSLDTTKIQECNKDIWSVVRLRFGPIARYLKQFDGFTLKDNSWLHTSPDASLIHNNSFNFEDAHTYSTCWQIKRHTPLTLDWINQMSFGQINTVTFTSWYKPLMKCSCIITWLNIFSRRFFTMDATDYWLFAQEYSIWNATVAALQLWTEDLDPQMLSNAIKRVYIAAFCSDSAQHLWICKRRNIIRSLCDHFKQSFWMKSHLRRYRLQKWEWKFKCSHSSMLSTMTIPCFDTRKFIFSDLPLLEHAHLLVPSTQCATAWHMNKRRTHHLIPGWKTTHLRTYWLTIYPV